MTPARNSDALAPHSPASSVRNGVVHHRAGGAPRSLNDEVSWIGRIGQALEEDRFTLHAQPILVLNRHDPRPRYELLVRMISRQGELILPSDFLELAERFEMIQEIDRWVISKAARLLAEQQALGKDVVFEINLSPRTLVAPGLGDFIIDEVNTAGAAARGLCLEFTETEAIVDLHQARELATRLQALGYSFAIDDFGAGFASLYYVKHLDFDYLKIDGEFIEDLPESETDRLVVEAVVAMVRGMGKRTIAEGVSSQATFDLVRALGVDFAQGYHVAHPRPVWRAVAARAPREGGAYA